MLARLLAINMAIVIPMPCFVLSWLTAASPVNVTVIPVDTALVHKSFPAVIRR